MRRVAAVLFLIFLSPAIGEGSAPPAGETSPEAPENSLFRRVRQAVTAGEEPTLYELARADPWGFREVINQLSDLVAQQGGRASAADAFTRIVVAGHLAAIHLQVTGDQTLAERLRQMMNWTGREMAERAGVDDLLARVEAPAPPSPQGLETGIGVCERLQDDRCLGLVQAALGRVHERADRLGIAVLWYERAAEALRRAGELVRLRNALLSAGQIFLELGRAGDAAESLGAAASVSEQVGDREARAGSLLLLAEALAGAGEREQAFAALGEARRIAFSENLPLVAARAILFRAVLRDEQGKRVLPASAEDYLTAARLAQQAGDLPTVVDAYSRAAGILLRAGETERAAEILERGLSAARLADLELEIQTMLLIAAELDAQLGDYDRAVKRLQNALAIARSGQRRAHEIRILELLGTTLLEAGRIDAAVGPLRQARDMARQGGAVAIEGRAEGALGAVALARGNIETARRHYSRSVELLERAGDAFQSLRMRQMLEQIDRTSSATPGT